MGSGIQQNLVEVVQHAAACRMILIQTVRRIKVSLLNVSKQVIVVKPNYFKKQKISLLIPYYQQYYHWINFFCCRHKYHLSKLLSVASLQWKYNRFSRLQSIFDRTENCKVFLQWHCKRQNVCIWGYKTRTTGTKKAEKSSRRWWWFWRWFWWY